MWPRFVLFFVVVVVLLLLFFLSFFFFLWVSEFGFNVAFNNFSVISRRCLVATGSSVLTFIVLPHWSILSQTWYHTQSHYPDTGSTSPSSTPQVWVPSEEQLVPFLRLWYVAARDRTRDLPFPGADTLPTELSGSFFFLFFFFFFIIFFFFFFLLLFLLVPEPERRAEVFDYDYATSWTAFHCFL